MQFTDLSRRHRMLGLWHARRPMWRDTHRCIWQHFQWLLCPIQLLSDGQPVTVGSSGASSTGNDLKYLLRHTFYVPKHVFLIGWRLEALCFVTFCFYCWFPLLWGGPAARQAALSDRAERTPASRVEVPIITRTFLRRVDSLFL